MQQQTKRTEARHRVHRDNFFWTSEYYVTLSPYENQGRSQDGSRGEAPRRNLYPDT